jgi:hypothetical protein
MIKSGYALLLAITIAKWVSAQGTVSVDLLDPSETSGEIPAHLRIVDVFVDIATTDVWTACGINVRSQNGGALVYADVDSNQNGYQPGLFNLGVEGKFFTSLSRPRGRDAESRFTNAGAAAAGSYPTQPPSPTMTPSELGVAFFRNPPATSTTPSVDGYIARVAVDVSAIPGAPAGNDFWAVGPSAPPGAPVVLISDPLGPALGTVIATFDVPAISGFNWQLWFVPEPGSIGLLIFGALAMRCLHRVERSRKS